MDLPNSKICAGIRKLLRSQLKRAFGRDLDAALKDRNRKLWILGVDTNQKTLVDVCGDISPEDLATINSRGFFDTDAGYRADAHDALGVSEEVDIFLLNTAHFSARPEFIEPIVVHELAHMLEQTGIIPEPVYNDDENADAILGSLRANVLKSNMRHNKTWALHLAIGARTMMIKKLTNHSSIRAYLEAAVPTYDRSGDIRAKKGW